jgi:glycyl-tRNA synthetase
MKSVYEINGLVHWSEREIDARERFTRFFAEEMRAFLHGQNKAWEFERTEGPLMLPRAMVNPNYTEHDLWAFALHDPKEAAMVARPETTQATYSWMRDRLESQVGLALPYCCWQVGKSFRNEVTDSFRLNQVRLKEFHQQEFQCVYGVGTANDYQENCLPVVQRMLADATGFETRIVDSDRLPSYSLRTVDVEIFYADRWMEICSISKRTDFPIKYSYVNKKNQTMEVDVLVLEVALGLDRITAAWSSKS